jgi:predicted nucleotidyltransferase
MNLLVKTIFGSHLYGTNTEESDMDYKGIFMPSKKEMFLGKIPKCISETTKSGNTSKNTAEGIDTDIYSLQYFVELALQGETVALDMLHTPKELTITSLPIWDELVSLRSKFYTKNLKAFVVYCRRQAAKYGIKGSRISAAKSVILLLRTSLRPYNADSKMLDIWHKLPEGDHLYFVENSPNGLRQYQVCGKIFQETVKLGYVIKNLERFVEQYGKRARLAEQNEGIDWKAVSHAVRVAYQTRSILQEGTMIFPLPEAYFVKKIKQGELHYIKEVLPVLENLMDRIELLSKYSKLPEKPDREFWENFMVEKVEEFYGWS